MATAIHVPELGDPGLRARLALWLKQEGEAVAAGEAVVEMETDKTTIEVEASVSGILERIHVPAGTSALAPGTLLGIIAEGGVRDPVSPAVLAVPVPLDLPVAELRGAGASAPPAPVRLRAEDGVDATPLARQMALASGLDLGTLPAAIQGLRVTKRDVDGALGLSPRAAASAADRPASARSAGDSAGGRRPFREVDVSPLQRVTAMRLVESQQTVPHFYLQAVCRADALLDLRARNNARAGAGHVTVSDLLIFLTARALTRVPLANAAWGEQAVRVFDGVDMAVAVNTVRGLITPVIRDCHAKDVSTISAELKRLAERAREGTLKPEEYSGATFTISNLGMYGVTSITPIVNPPHACILGVGSVESHAIVDPDGRVVAGRTIACTLAADHRAIDGATGAQLMGEIRRLIEDPLAAFLYA